MKRQKPVVKTKTAMRGRIAVSGVSTRTRAVKIRERRQRVSQTVLPWSLLNNKSR